MKDILAERNTGYDLRLGNESQLPKVHTTTYRIETITFLGNRLWSTLPNIIKQASTFSIFKCHIKCWKCENCNSRLCKIYTCFFYKKTIILPEHQFSQLFPKLSLRFTYIFLKFYRNKLAVMVYTFDIDIAHLNLNSIFNILSAVTKYRFLAYKTLNFWKLSLMIFLRFS